MRIALAGSTLGQRIMHVVHVMNVVSNNNIVPPRGRRMDIHVHLRWRRLTANNVRCVRCERCIELKYRAATRTALVRGGIGKNGN